MRKLSCLICAAAAVTLLGCPTVDPGDPFESLTTVSNDDTTGDGDGDQTGDGDGSPGDGDGSPGDGDGAPGDGDGDECGGFGAACSGETCCEGLSCQANGTCGVGDPTGDGDGDGDPGNDPWNPMGCMAPSQPLMVGNIPGSFCSAPCSGDPDCPSGPAGTQPACALTTMQGEPPSFCALVCQPANDACPAGSSCKDLMDPMNPGLGLCTYP